MKIVYYASFAPAGFAGDHYMLFQEPDSLLKLVAKDRNRDNKYENYIDCPAFQNNIKNTFVIRNTIDMKLRINNRQITATNDASVEAVNFWLSKLNSRTLGVVNYHLNYIFFSNDLEITTMPAFLHNSDFQNKLTYIPGTYNIGSWFRPVEGAFELKQDLLDLDLKIGDPLYYIKFNTDEKIKFKRFEFTPKLHQMTMGCMNYKRLKLHSSLRFLYNMFHKSMANKLILKEIKNNIIS